MFVARTALAGLAIAAAPTGCGLEVGHGTGGADAGRSAAVPTRPAQTPPASGIPPSDGARPPAHAGARRRVDRSQLSAAREDAQAFFTSYVAYLYGQLPARRVFHLSPSLRQQLDSDRAEATPAERGARARITRLSVAIGYEPMTMVAVAVVRADGEVLRLTAMLQPSRSTWRVVAVAG
jgi:hypothetical protein